MDEKGNKLKIDINSKKLDWEAPKLISLDKGKTEGGPKTETYEDVDYTDPAS